jgi:hypothetical protein
MANRFQLKKLFSSEEITNLVQNFGFKRMEEEEIAYAIQSAFSDYILGALSEISGESDDNKKLYVEAVYYLDKAEKLLEGMPHPAGKISYRLGSMIDTLNKLAEGRINVGAERATRFMEKNLIRKLRDVWAFNTSTPFHSGSDGSGKNPCDFILQCFAAAGKEYPEVLWFHQVDHIIANSLIKSIKR